MSPRFHVGALAAALLLGAAFAVGCGQEDEGDITGHPIRNGICTSHVQWSGGASAEMDPGMDCVGCHAGNEGPDYRVAGTIFFGPHDEDLCGGVSGVTVTITDSAGHVFTQVTNSTGNFAFRPSEMPGWTPPYTARIDSGGSTRAMSTPQSDGACNACHSPDGANGAPGRILAPGA